MNTGNTTFDRGWFEGNVLSDRKVYEDDLKRRQKEHLDQIQIKHDQNWQPCMHDQCTECHGTGLKRYGGFCVHGISCPCPKCTITFT